jgi:tripartite motif-containing protein 71
VPNTTGNVYVSDTFNHRIQEFGPTGAFIRTWGVRSVNDPNAMSYPRGVAVDQSNGNVWLNNTRSGTIKEFTSTGGFVAQFGSEGSAANQYYYARGIWVAPTGRVFVPDSGNLRFKALNQNGSVAWTVPCGTKALSGNFILFGCTSATTDATGNVYAAAPTENALYKWNASGTLIWKKVFARGVGQGQLNSPYGIAIRNDRLWVSEMNNNRLSVFDLNGAFQGTFGGLGTGDGQFSRPTALTFDNAGRLYVCDSVNERIEVFQT